MSIVHARERAVGVTAGVTVAGLALVGTGASDAGTFLTLLGLAALMLAVHRYGRWGVDDGSGQEHAG